MSNRLSYFHEEHRHGADGIVAYKPLRRWGLPADCPFSASGEFLSPAWEGDMGGLDIVAQFHLACHPRRSGRLTTRKKRTSTTPIRTIQIIMGNGMSAQQGDAVSAALGCCDKGGCCAGRAANKAGDEVRGAECLL